MPSVNFFMQYQQRTNWCWAATGVSVRVYYQPASPLTQCVLVCATLGRNDCCNNLQVAAHPCNVTGDLGAVLQTLAHLQATVARPATLAEIAVQIAALRPLALRVGWVNGGGHAMACTGYFLALNGLYYLQIQDPWFGTSLVPLVIFPALYWGRAGVWTHTYFTRP